MKSRPHFLFAMLFVFCISFSNGTKDQSEPQDVLADAQALNSENRPKPPNSFRTGHVTAKNIDNYLAQLPDGYTINVPHNSAIPTPTIYQGKLYTSGGFGSKSFYCFDSKSGQLIWAIDLDDDGPSSAVVRDDVVVFNTESCTIFACDALTGKMLWSHWLGDPLMSTPTIVGNKVFSAYPATQGSFHQNKDVDVGNENEISASKLRATHVLACFDLHSGEILWQKWIDGDVMTAPVAVGTDLYVVTFPGTFYRFEQATGKILAATSARATSAPIMANGRIFTSRRSDDGKSVKESIAAYHVKSAKMEKQYAERAAPYLDQKVQGNSKLKSQAMDLDAGNGFAGGAPGTSGWQKAASNIGQSNVSSLQAFQGSRVVHFKGRNFNVMGNELVCTDAESGKTLWLQKVDGDLEDIGGYLATPPISVGGKILIATHAGSILLFDQESGRKIISYETNEVLRFQPVVEDGWIYVSTQNGKIRAINTADKTMTGWPMLGGNNGHTNEAIRR